MAGVCAPGADRSAKRLVTGRHVGAAPAWAWTRVAPSNPVMTTTTIRVTTRLIGVPPFSAPVVRRGPHPMTSRAGDWLYGFHEARPVRRRRLPDPAARRHRVGLPPRGGDRRRGRGGAPHPRPPD